MRSLHGLVKGDKVLVINRESPFAYEEFIITGFTKDRKNAAMVMVKKPGKPGSGEDATFYPEELGIVD